MEKQDSCATVPRTVYIIGVEEHRKKLHHYNSQGHAHELTFSCFRRRDYLADSISCEMLLEVLARGREIYKYGIWAYVLMPNHVHSLLWPREPAYDIAKIESGLKDVMSKRYGKYLKEHDPQKYQNYLVQDRDQENFRFWQPGGGFDRNLWNAKSIHDSIRYIEENPVRRGLAKTPSDWQWSSAYASKHNEVVVPDVFQMPVLLDAQRQRVGVL